MNAIACHGEGDARRAVSGGRDKTLLVWDLVKGGAPLLKLEGHTGMVFAIACHGEGDARRAVSGGDDKTLLVWDLDKGGAPLLKLVGHDGGGARDRVPRRGRRAARRERRRRQDAARVGPRQGRRAAAQARGAHGVA